MNNKNLMKLSALFLTLVLCWPAGAQAEGTNVSSDPLVGPTESAMGRVFGVEGKGGDIGYYSADFSNHSPKNAAFRSALVPGWGQMFNGQQVKGSLLLGTAVITTVSAFALHDKSKQTYDDYVSAGRKDGSLYDDYKRQNTQVFLLGTITAVVWGFSIFDAYRNAYNPLWSSDSHRIELAADTEGAKVVWHQKF